jgi:phytoene desaturase
MLGGAADGLLRPVAGALPGGRARRVVIVGAGLGGLSAALHLLGAGHEVTVLEQSARPGGRAGLLEVDGYRFDTGPTVLTMPELIADALGCVGESLADWLELTRLDPAYRATFADGSAIEMLADVEAMHAQIAALCGAREADGYLRMVRFLRRAYAIERGAFIERNLDSPLQLLGPSLAKLAGIGGFRRLGPKIASYLSDDRLRRLFTFQSLYAGVGPAQALALYAVIAYLDSVAGVWFPRGGMHAVPAAMAAAAAKHGALIRCGARVEAVDMSGDLATGVRLAGGERIRADAVIINADAPQAIRALLPPGLRAGAGPRLAGARRALRARQSPSAVVAHIGSAGSPEHPSHHTLSFGAAWAGTFREIIRRGQLMSDPSLLLSNPTRTDPSLAPPGRHAYYALFPVPNLDRAPLDWATIGPRYYDEMLAVLAARGLGGAVRGIETHRLVTPADWAAQGLAAGSPFSAAHTFARTGPFRMSTRPTRSPNLLFCGAQAQPGVGVPMVLLSGRLAALRLAGR